MNANELADKLDDIPVNDFESLDQHHYTRQAATMLRQQLAEIEALKAGFNKENPVKEVFNNEPVAWTGQNTFCKYCHRIPSQCSCTHPAKTLTDKEIRHLQAQCHLKNVGYDTFIMRFARAILKKASEK
jgi:hypothetical protein